MVKHFESDLSILFGFWQDILDSFHDTEFWYAEKGSMSSNSNSNHSKSASFRRLSLQKEEKWWLPVPCIPSCGLSEKARKQLKNNREFANQIHKAAMAINSTILAEMDIPESYIDTLPKVSPLTDHRKIAIFTLDQCKSVF